MRLLIIGFALSLSLLSLSITFSASAAQAGSSETPQLMGAAPVEAPPPGGQKMQQRAPAHTGHVMELPPGSGLETKAPALPAAQGKPPAAPGVQPAQQPTEAAQPQVAQGPVEPTITPQDYSMYLATGHRNKTWDDLVQSAFKAFDEGNFPTAGIFLRRAYETGCRDPLVLFRLGIIKESRGQFKEAAEVFAQAADGVAQRYPAHPLATYLFKHAGRAFYESDDYKRAATYLEKSLEKLPDDFMALMMLGQIARMEKRLSDAKGFFERAIAAQPPTGLTPDPKKTILGELIIISFDLKDYGACRSYIDQVLAVSPQDPVANAYRSQLEKMKQTTKQKEVIDKMINQ